MQNTTINNNLNIDERIQIRNSVSLCFLIIGFCYFCYFSCVLVHKYFITYLRTYKREKNNTKFSLIPCDCCALNSFVVWHSEHIQILLCKLFMHRTHVYTTQKIRRNMNTHF